MRPSSDPDEYPNDSPEPEVAEECGVFGVWAPGEDVANLTYYGLYALQHRGQEAAGMAVSDGRRTVVYKDLGLVSQVFDEQVLSSLKGHIAVGHCRYSTTGSTTWENAQPTFRTTAAGSGIALGHNGNLVNTAELRDEVGKLGKALGARARIVASTDSDLITELLAATAADIGVEEAAMRLLPRLRGAYSLVFADEQTLYAARDPHGVRPLVLGRLERGWVIASETAALDIVGASMVREVEPGEMLAIDANGMRSSRFATPEPKGCVFEYVYLARPDTAIAGRSVHATRVEIGRRLAVEAPVEADLVMPTPESGTPAAIGYAQGSGIPYGQGLVKNAYVGRTFIQPSQTIRQLGIRLKLNPLREVVRGKRLVVVDDSIVRGNTQRAIVRMLREAGALEVHIRIASPPVRWPCFYGIDFATRAELIASGLDVEGVRRSVGADTLGYVSLEGLIAATEQPRTRLCMACFDGTYPIPLPDEARLGKHLLEDLGGIPHRSLSATVPPRRCTDPRDTMPSNTEGASYAAAGVDIEAGERAVDALRPYAEKATRPEVLGGIGGFAGLFALKLGRYTEPVLAASTDGVGTKVAIAQALDKHDTIGLDLVAMVVDDLVVCGAEPLFLQDYIAVGKLVPAHVAAVVAGIADGCRRAGCALLGGETAEHPGMMEAGGYDLSATGVGIVEADAMLRPDRVRPGDVLIGMGSSGLHSNGYSLARDVLLRIARMPLEGHVEEFGRTLGEELLVPTTIYARDCLALAAETSVRTFAHITGGGLARNLARVLPEGLGAVLERGSWTPQPVFRVIAARGRVDRAEMEQTFNMGVGMVAVLPPDDVDRAMAVLMARHVPAWVLGAVRRGRGVELVGEHPRF